MMSRPQFLLVVGSICVSLPFALNAIDALIMNPDLPTVEALDVVGADDCELGEAKTGPDCQISVAKSCTYINTSSLNCSSWLCPYDCTMNTTHQAPASQIYVIVTPMDCQDQLQQTCYAVPFTNNTSCYCDNPAIQKDCGQYDSAVSATCGT